MTNENNLNLTEMIRKIHDGVAREMYCKGSDTNFDCKDCIRVMNEWLDEYDNHVIEQYKANTRLNDTIREIHDNVAKEMYCKGIDDLTERLKDYFIIPHDARVIDMIAKQLKAGDKE